MHRIPWRRVAAAVVAALVALAVVFGVLDVGIRGADGLTRSCGSSFDVLAGRTDWRVWRAQDLSDTPVQATLPRAAGCPSAVNHRTAWAGVLLIGAAVLGIGVVAHRPTPRRSLTPLDGRRVLGRVATVAMVVGATLTGAGVVGLALLLANPRATLFLYVSRPTAFLIGVLLLEPAVVLLLAGWALRVLARTPSRGGDAA